MAVCICCLAVGEALTTSAQGPDVIPYGPLGRSELVQIPSAAHDVYVVTITDAQLTSLALQASRATDGLFIRPYVVSKPGRLVIGGSIRVALWTLPVSVILRPLAIGGRLRGQFVGSSVGLIPSSSLLASTLARGAVSLLRGLVFGPPVRIIAAEARAGQLAVTIQISGGLRVGSHPAHEQHLEHIARILRARQGVPKVPGATQAHLSTDVPRQPPHATEDPSPTPEPSPICIPSPVAEPGVSTPVPGLPVQLIESNICLPMTAGMAPKAGLPIGQ